MSARATLEKRVKTLEEQNATLRAENVELRERLRRSALADAHLAQTGRVLPP
jgi:regulator of replication initiation timing